MTLNAGIDLRACLAREAERSSGRLRKHLRTIAANVNEGNTIAEGLGECDDYFPPLLRPMIDVGERTGRIERVLMQLSDYYQSKAEWRRRFISSLTWPLFELGAAIFIIGVLIYVWGFIHARGVTFEPVGFGLYGERGVVIYLCFLACCAAAGFALFRFLTRGSIWTRHVQYIALKIPLVGRALEHIALSRVAWALSAALDTSIDVKTALRLGIEASQLSLYEAQLPKIFHAIDVGATISEAFDDTKLYPREFTDTLAVGEQSGQIVESMSHLAGLYAEQARQESAQIAVALNWIIWGAVATIIVFFIFRFASFYMQAAFGGL